MRSGRLAESLEVVVEAVRKLCDQFQLDHVALYSAVSQRKGQIHFQPDEGISITRSRDPCGSSREQWRLAVGRRFDLHGKETL